MSQHGIVPCLWFDGQAEQAAEYYCRIFPNSRILSTSRWPEGSPGPAGDVLTVEFEIDGTRFTGLNGGPEFRFTEAVSFQVGCKDQSEVDYYWNTLVGDGGEESMCGWLKDRYSVSWQIVPDGITELLSDPDPERAARAMQSMLGMRKLDIAAMRAAADGDSVPA